MFKKNQSADFVRILPAIVPMLLFLSHLTPYANACGGFAPQKIKLDKEFEDHGITLRILNTFEFEVSAYNYKTGKPDTKIYTYDRFLKGSPGAFEGGWCSRNLGTKQVERNLGTKEYPDMVPACGSQAQGYTAISDGPLPIVKTDSEKMINFTFNGNKVKMDKVGYEDKKFYALMASEPQSQAEAYMIISRAEMPTKVENLGGLGRLLNEFAEPKPTNTLWLKGGFSLTEEGKIGFKSRGGAVDSNQDGIDMSKGIDAGPKEFEIGCGGLKAIDQETRTAPARNQSTDAL